MNSVLALLLFVSAITFGSEIRKSAPFLTQGTAWVDGFGYEQDGRYKVDDVKLCYYTTAGDTLINDKTYSRILRTRKCKTSYKLEEDADGKEYVSEKELIVQDDTLCFFMREDDAGDVWLYTEDKNVFYEVSQNTLFETLADDLIGRELFLFNSKKKYAIGDALPLGMSALVDPNGFQEGKDYWHIYPLDVEDVSVINLLDGNSYPIYNNYFVESIGPLDGPLSGIGSPNSYNLDFKKLFAFYRDGQAIYKDEGYLAALEEVFPNILDSLIGATLSTEVPVAFTEGQMATIIMPTAPEASKGKYYRLDKVDGNEIIFEQELQPKAHVPYIIVPSEDFCINLRSLHMEGCCSDTASADGIYFIGSFVSEELNEQEGFRIKLIDTTPDCGFSLSEEAGGGGFIGALHAYLLISEDVYGNLNIVLHDKTTGLQSLQESKSKAQNDVYDLSGRKTDNGKLPLGVYIEGGRKKLKIENP